MLKNAFRKRLQVTYGQDTTKRAVTEALIFREPRRLGVKEITQGCDKSSIMNMNWFNMLHGLWDTQIPLEKWGFHRLM